MSESNPFADYIDQDKTILRPNPGGRKTNFSPPPDESQGFTSDFTLPTNLSSNPITAHATALLSLVSQLRHTIAHSDSAGLRNRAIQEIKQFEKNLLNQQIAPEQIRAAHYVLCAAVDEAVLHTPWGEQSLWRTQSLLVTFHKEAWGGEKFFLILKNALQNPATHLNLLELLYLCLSLGFKGKYHIQEQGAMQLAQVQENLYQLIQRQRGAGEKELSPCWTGATNQQTRLDKLLPLPVLFVGTAALLLLIFLGFWQSIGQVSEPVLTKLSINVPIYRRSIDSDPPPSIYPTIAQWRGFLKTEIVNNKVKVFEEKGQTLIRLVGTVLFPSGQAEPHPDYLPILQRISNELAKKVSRPIVVEGHTDNVPILSPYFANNYALSTARAEAVVARLIQYQPSLRLLLSPEGKSDSKPIQPNNTFENRAENRRVDIVF